MSDRPPPPAGGAPAEQQWGGQPVPPYLYQGYYGQQGYDSYQHYGQQAAYYGQPYAAAAPPPPPPPPPASDFSAMPQPPQPSVDGNSNAAADGSGYSQAAAGTGYGQSQQQGYGGYGGAYSQNYPQYRQEQAHGGAYQGYPASYYGQQQAQALQQPVQQAQALQQPVQQQQPQAQKQLHPRSYAAPATQATGANVAHPAHAASGKQPGAPVPAWKAAADRVAAIAAHAAGPAMASSRGIDGYHAVAPPSAMSQTTTAGAGRRTFSIRPQLPKQRPPEPPNPVVVAFNQAASKIGSSAPAVPAYTAVQLPKHQQQRAAPVAAAVPAVAVSPQQWPPALKAYVERAFKTADVRQRPKLQEVLKQVIGDAQTSGELWTRDWETMPLPDLSQSAADAAAVLAEVAAVSGPAVGAGAAVPVSRWSAPQQPLQHQQHYSQQQYAAQQQQQQQYTQQYAQQQQQQHAQKQQQQQQQFKYADRRQRQRLDTGDDDRYGRRSRGRKRSYPDDRSDSSSRSDSDEEQWSYAERQRRQRRAGRFQDASGSKKHGGSTAWWAEQRRQRVLEMLEEGEDEEVDWDAVAIKGTCQQLEKSYFRLTSAPDPATVRPESVLRRALERLVGLLRAKEVNYFYALDQFKGMRQDCTVQHIRNDLAVQVYEAHARSALEYGDVAEYNQCQSQLRTLYNEGVPGCRIEFLAYRIIYQAVHAKHGEILQLLNTLKKVKPEEALHPEVAHALAVRAAVASSDYARFFKLYACAPALGRALMDIYVPTLRYDALNAVVKAFKPSLPVPFLAAQLGFVAAAPLSSPGQGPTSGAQAASSVPVSGELAGKSFPPSNGGPVGKPPFAEAPDGGGSSAGHAAAAGGQVGVSHGAAAAGGSSVAEPPPGCIEPFYQGEHTAKAGEVEGCHDCIAWLSECGAVVTGGDSSDVAEVALDCKASTGQLQMPEEKTKVAHGDQNLTLDDFLSKAGGVM